MADAETITKVTKYMSTLNKNASESMQEVGVNACTDVTGFGLLGHACEMVQDSNVGMMIYSSAVPIFPEAIEFARMGLVPGGTQRNREFRAPMVELASELSDYMSDILFDPQTSGGLLISVGAARAGILLARLHKVGVAEAAVIGEVMKQPAQRIVIK